jgi:putative membrane protein
VPEPDDATRRTWLAAERTWLAWWRTGAAAAVASLAVGGVVPDLADAEPWPFVALGVGYGVLAAALFWLGARRWRATGEALRAGGFEPLGGGIATGLSAAGAALAVTTVILLIVAA